MNVKKTFSHGLVMAAVAITGAFGLMACSDNDDNTVVEPEYPPLGTRSTRPTTATERWADSATTAATHGTAAARAAARWAAGRTTAAAPGSNQHE